MHEWSESQLMIRAAVRTFVVACGVAEDRVYAEGFAGTRRLTDTLNELEGQQNRRVEVHCVD